MKNSDSWTRRKFSKAVVAAQLLVSSGAITLTCACEDGPGTTTSFLSMEKEILRLAMDEIIPSNGTMPAASEIGSVEYVGKIAGELPELMPLFKEVIKKLEATSLQYQKANFSRQNKDGRIKVLAQLEQVEPELFDVLKNFTYESYYTHAKVFELINYEPFTTGGSGPVMEPFDEQLLDRVKRLPPGYIRI